MPSNLPAISGRGVIRLLRRDGWTEAGRRTHGVALTRRDADGRVRVTIVPEKRGSLPAGTLAAILGPRQSNIGHAGLLALIERYGR